jgi:hypothetical protein
LPPSATPFAVLAVFFAVPVIVNKTPIFVEENSPPHKTQIKTFMQVKTKPANQMLFFNSSCG